MTWRRRLTWLTTAAVLVLITVIVPRISAAPDRDPFPTRVSLGESTQVGGGRVTIDRITASARWTNGEDALSLESEDGLFVEMQALAHPDREATFLKAVLRSQGRSYDITDRLDSYNDQAEPGFDSPQTVTFEVPADALDDGEVWAYFTAESAVRISLRDAGVKRVPVLERPE